MLYMFYTAKPLPCRPQGSERRSPQVQRAVYAKFAHTTLHYRSATHKGIADAAFGDETLADFET